MGRVNRFLGEVRTELKKVSWSTRQEIISSTGVVIVMVFLLTVFIGIVDLILSRLIGFIIR